MVQRQILSIEQAEEVARVALRIEALLGGGQDIEWAIANGQVWVLQARPITAVPTTCTTERRR